MATAEQVGGGDDDFVVIPTQQELDEQEYLDGGVALLAEFCELDGGMRRFVYPSQLARVTHPSSRGPSSVSSAPGGRSDDDAEFKSLTPKWQQTVKSFISTRLFSCNFAFSHNVTLPPPPGGAAGDGDRRPLSHVASMFIDNVEVPRAEDDEDNYLGSSTTLPGGGLAPMYQVSAVICSASIPDYRARGYVRNMNIALLVEDSETLRTCSLTYVTDEMRDVCRQLCEAAEHRYLIELPLAAQAFFTVNRAVQHAEQGDAEAQGYVDSLDLTPRQLQELGQECRIIMDKYYQLHPAASASFVSIPIAVPAAPAGGGQKALTGSQTKKKKTPTAPGAAMMKTLQKANEQEEDDDEAEKNPFQHKPRLSPETTKRILKELLLQRGNERLRPLDEICATAPRRYRPTSPPAEAGPGGGNVSGAGAPTSTVVTLAKEKLKDLVEIYVKNVGSLWMELSGLQSLTNRLDEVELISDQYVQKFCQGGDEAYLYGADQQDSLSLRGVSATTGVVIPSSDAMLMDTTGPQHVDPSRALDYEEPLPSVDMNVPTTGGGGVEGVGGGGGPASALAGVVLANPAAMNYRNEMKKTHERRWQDSVRRQEQSNYWKITAYRQDPGDEGKKMPPDVSVHMVHSVPRRVLVTNQEETTQGEQLLISELPAQVHSEPWPHSAQIWLLTNYYFSKKGKASLGGPSPGLDYGAKAANEEACRRVLDVIYHAFLDRPFVIHVKTYQWNFHFQRLFWLIAGCWVNRGKPSKEDSRELNPAYSSGRNSGGNPVGSASFDQFAPDDDVASVASAPQPPGHMNQQFVPNKSDCYIYPHIDDKTFEVRPLTLKEVLFRRIVFVHTSDDAVFDHVVSRLPKDTYIRLEGETLKMNGGGGKGHNSFKRYLGDKDECPLPRGFNQDAVMPPPPMSEGLLKRVLPFTTPFGTEEGGSVYNQYAVWALMVVERVKSEEVEGERLQAKNSAARASKRGSYQYPTNPGKVNIHRAKVTHVTASDCQRVLCAQPISEVAMRPGGPKNDFSLAVGPAANIPGVKQPNKRQSAAVGGGAGGEAGFYVPSELVREVAIYPRDLEIVAAMATRMLGLSEADDRAKRV